MLLSGCCDILQQKCWYQESHVQKECGQKQSVMLLAASLGSYMYINRLPGKRDTLNACQHHPALQQRSWQNIKRFYQKHPAEE